MLFCRLASIGGGMGKRPPPAFFRYGPILPLNGRRRDDARAQHQVSTCEHDAFDSAGSTPHPAAAHHTKRDNERGLRGDQLERSCRPAMRNTGTDANWMMIENPTSAMSEFSYSTPATLLPTSHPSFAGLSPRTRVRRSSGQASAAQPFRCSQAMRATRNYRTVCDPWLAVSTSDGIPATRSFPVIYRQWSWEETSSSLCRTRADRRFFADKSAPGE
jgi:hypothetical protein